MRSLCDVHHDQASPEPTTPPWHSQMLPTLSFYVAGTKHSQYHTTTTCLATFDISAVLCDFTLRTASSIPCVRSKSPNLVPDESSSLVCNSEASEPAAIAHCDRRDLSTAIETGRVAKTLKTIRQIGKGTIRLAPMSTVYLEIWHMFVNHQNKQRLHTLLRQCIAKYKFDCPKRVLSSLEPRYLNIFRNNLSRNLVLLLL